MSTNKCRELRKEDVAKQCKNRQSISSMQKAIAELTKGRYPHFCIVGGYREWQLLYAGVAKDMSLDFIADKVDMLKHYRDGTLTVEDSGLDTWEVLSLVGFGRGVTVALDMENNEISVLVLPRKGDTSYGIVRKDIYTVIPVERA